MLKYLRAFILILLLSLMGITLPVNASNQSGRTLKMLALQNGGATYRFVNLLPDQSIDLYRNGNAEYFNNATGTLTAERIISEGSHDFALYPLNAGPDSTTPDAELTVNLSAQTNMLLIAYEQSGTIMLTAHGYDLNPVTVNQARFELYNLAAEQPLVTAITQNQDVLLEEVVPGSVSIADIPGGVYQVTLQDSTSGEALAQTSLNTISGNLVTAVLYGESELHVIQIENALPVKGAFRFIHAGRISPVLDVYADNTLIATGVEYAYSTEYLSMDTGTHTIELYESGFIPGVDAPLWTGSVSISRNAPITGVALGEGSLRLLTYQDDHQLIPENQARLRVINAAVNLPQLTVRDDSSTPLVGGLEYVLGSRNQNIDAGFRTLVFRETSGIDYVTLTDFEFQPNHFYTFIVIGNALIDGSIEVLPLDWNWQQAADTAGG